MASTRRGPSQPQSSLSSLEESLARQGRRRVAGVDEAGRGPLAGPVVAAAVVLPLDWENPGVKDSKALSPRRREELAPIIRESCLAWGIGACDPREIDRLNIHHASLLAMRRAVENLGLQPDYLLVDGRFTVDIEIEQQAVVKGDARLRVVAAASILAKVERDGVMLQWHEKYPAYNFAANKGYPTAEHRRALERCGPCPIHRRNYRPVAQLRLDLGDD
jgi:ribonuclease HII